VGYGKRQLEVRGYRGQIPSPGRPTVAWRQDRVRFWAAIAAGAMTEDAAAGGRVVAGRVPLVPSRWRGESMLARNCFRSLSVVE
jgi:hypothetical protein